MIKYFKKLINSEFSKKFEEFEVSNINIYWLKIQVYLVQKAFEIVLKFCVPNSWIFDITYFET